MDNSELKENVSALEVQLEKILKEGCANLKTLYFDFAIMLEEKADAIGLHTIYFTKDLMKINNKPGKEITDIKEKDLIRFYPKVKTAQALEIFKEYNFLYHNSFFESLQHPYDGFVGIMFSHNEVRFENLELTHEFELYKINLRKKQLEQELPNEKQEQIQKNKI